MSHLRHCNTETRRMQRSYHLSYGLWSLLDLVFRSNIEKLLHLDQEVLKGLLSTPVRLSKSQNLAFLKIDPKWSELTQTDPFYIQMLHTFFEKSGEYWKMLLVRKILIKPYLNNLKIQVTWIKYSLKLMGKQSNDKLLQKISLGRELYDHDSCLWKLLDNIEQFGNL